MHSDNLQAHGYRIPFDYSVTGFDDLPTIQYNPGILTTVHQQRNEIGRKAAELLMQQIKSGLMHPQPVKVRLDTPLIVRGSVKNLAE